MSSIKDVAKLAGVSVTTVSHVLNQTRFVSPEKTNQVMEAVEELQYKPSAMARNLKVTETKMIGVIIPDLYGSFFPDLINSIENTLASFGYRFFICHSGQDPVKEAGFLEQLISYKVDGLIIAITGPTENIKILQWLEKQEFPIVYVDREPPPEVNSFSIVSDNIKASKEATAHLFESYPTVAVISPYPAPNPVMERIKGYKEICKERKVKPILSLSEGWGEEVGYRQVDGLLAQYPDPIGVFCTTNSVTRGVIRRLQELQVHIPERIGIVGFDDANWMTLVKPEISVVRTQPIRIGEIAVSKLMTLLNKDLTIEANEVRIEAPLIVRGSSRREKN